MTEQKLDELLPCPFHKLNTSVDLTETDYGRWCVACGGCGTSSGHHNTKEQAVASWNEDRASTTREAELQAELKECEDANDAMMNKLGDNCCACSVDKITHVCIYHQPKVNELQAEVKRLRKALEVISGCPERWGMIAIEALNQEPKS